MADCMIFLLFALFLDNIEYLLFICFCLVSGTAFMARLHEQLKYFVNMKISSDKSWEGVTVYLSGHEVIKQ